MKKKVLFITFLNIFATAVLSADNECGVDADVIGLKYRITTKVLSDTKQFLRKGKRTKDKREHLTIWRNHNSVMHERGASDITDVWIHVDDNSMALTRYFDKYQRSIEYDVADLPQKSLGLWDAKRQIVPTIYKQQMKKIGEQGNGCDRVEYYAYASPNHSYMMTWSPVKEAMTEYLTNINNTVSYWQLLNTITDTKVIENSFITRDNWQSTDYTDIGDNESDPFLAKMITLGFIQHSDSGFYDTKGRPLNNGMHNHVIIVAPPKKDK